MTLDDVLQDLIQHLETNGNNTLAWEQVREWPEDAVFIFQDAGWIKPTAPSQNCGVPRMRRKLFHAGAFVSLHSSVNRNRYFVNCDVRDDMGRIPIPSEMLQQWQVSEYQVAQWLARELRLRGKPKRDKTNQTIQIGEIQGKKQSTGKLELANKESISLKASGHALLLIEVVYFKETNSRLTKRPLSKWWIALPQLNGTNLPLHAGKHVNWKHRKFIKNGIESIEN